MATKLFKESDSWGDSSGHGEELTFSFKKTKKAKVKKEKLKQKSFDENEIDPNAGRFVRPPGYLKPEEDEAVQEKTPGKKKKNKRKHEVSSDNGQSSDGITPEKKVKVQPTENGVTEPITYGDKLRESLKGSRFRFLNEQMYTQKGEESLKIFKDDPTAFDAYHEGYRHQIAQWPMNPLERIIKNMKKL